jgi:uncharacterized membrane protein
VAPGEAALRRDTRIVALVLAAIPLAILGSSTLVTIAIAHGASPWWRLPFRLMCHGIANRCLLLAGTPMPICARCTGVYLGFLLGIAAFPLFRNVQEHVMKIALLLAAAPMFVDGVTQLLGLRESVNPLRLATGLMAGAAFSLWALVAVETRARQRFASS